MTEPSVPPPSLADPNIQECPWPYYQEKHAQGFFFDEKLDMYVCVNYALMRSIMRNPSLFSNVNSQNIAHMRKPPQEVLDIQATALRPVNILVSSDPPEHTRVRGMLDDAFRPKQISKLREQISEIVHHVIDGFIAQGQCDIVADFAIPIPVTVIADMLGLPRSQAAQIKTWSDASVEPLGMMISDARWIECAMHGKDFQDYLIEQLEQRRQQPGSDLLTHLVQARDAQGNGLSMGEMVAVTQQLLVAGNETTTNAIAAGVELLAKNPQQAAQLRSEPHRILTFANEVLRLESPVQGLFRITTEEVEVGGYMLKKGARIMLRYAAANRDPAKYAEADTLNVERKNAGTHVGFGAGIHHCLGANLAREELVQAFTILLQRTHSIELDTTQQTRHHPSLILRGLDSLPISFKST